MIRVIFSYTDDESKSYGFTAWFDSQSVFRIHKSEFGQVGNFFLSTAFDVRNEFYCANFGTLTLKPNIQVDKLRMEFFDESKSAVPAAVAVAVSQTDDGKITDPNKIKELQNYVLETIFHPQKRQRDDEVDATEHNWFVAQLLQLKANTWDKLPTWSKWAIGGFFVLATLVALGAVTFGTAGLIAPAFVASVFAAMHLVAAGASVPVAAFIGALVGGAVAAFLFGAVPATVATAVKLAAPAAEVPSSLPSEKADDSSSLSWMAKLFKTDSKTAKNSTDKEPLVHSGSEQPSVSGTSNPQANAGKVSLFDRLRRHLPGVHGSDVERVNTSASADATSTASTEAKKNV